MLVQIHSPEAFKLGLKSRWCEEFVSYWSAKPGAAFAATIHGASSLLGQTLASDEPGVRVVKSSKDGFRVNGEVLKSRKKEILGDHETKECHYGLKKWKGGYVLCDKKQSVISAYLRLIDLTEIKTSCLWNTPTSFTARAAFPSKKQLLCSLLYLLYVFLIPISFHFLPAGWRDTNMRERRWVGGWGGERSHAAGRGIARRLHERQTSTTRDSSSSSHWSRLPQRRTSHHIKFKWRICIILK